jgi:hypothetical protein
VAHIVWLASYPKSGNTWLRAFLANYLADTGRPIAVNALPDFAFGDMRIEAYERVSERPAASLSEAEINRLRPCVHRFYAASRPGIVFVKTHTVLGTLDGVPTITPEVTSGAIYIVRNPLDVAVSFADHYGLTPELGAKALAFRGLEIEPKPGHVRQVVTDWTTHVESWRGARGLYLHLVRYEDMLASPVTAFSGILGFLKVPVDGERLRRAIDHASFSSLARQEERGGFVERSRNAARFFRKGIAGGWRDGLPPAAAAALIARHRPLMQELRYLDADGNPLV